MLQEEVAAAYRGQAPELRRRLTDVHEVTGEDMATLDARLDRSSTKRLLGDWVRRHGGMSRWRPTVT